jgi:hypothetical protein
MQRQKNLAFNHNNNRYKYQRHQNTAPNRKTNISLSETKASYAPYNHKNKQC